MVLENNIDLEIDLVIIFLYTIIRGVVRSSAGIKKTTYFLIETFTIFIILSFLVYNQGSMIKSITLMVKLVGNGLNMLVALFLSGHINMIHVIVLVVF